MWHALSAAVESERKVDGGSPVVCNLPFGTAGPSYRNGIRFLHFVRLRKLTTAVVRAAAGGAAGIVPVDFQSEFLRVRLVLGAEDGTVLVDVQGVHAGRSGEEIKKRLMTASDPQLSEVLKK